MAESAFIVAVPEAEPSVGALRMQHDQAARLGVPAHITVLFPFMDPALVDREVIDRCAHVIALHRRFDFQLDAVGRFEKTVYLKPTPSAPFIALTRALASAFPQYPPYRGVFASTIPHLTVAHGDAHEAQAVGTVLQEGLDRFGAVRSHCASLVLIENASGRWQRMHTFDLASSDERDAHA